MASSCLGLRGPAFSANAATSEASTNGWALSTRHVFRARSKGTTGARFNQRQAVARLVREAQIGASLRHPGLCAVLDAGQSDGDFYFVMEYREGPNLHMVIETQGPLPIPQACDFAHQLLNTGAISQGLRPRPRTKRPRPGAQDQRG